MHTPPSFSFLPSSLLLHPPQYLTELLLVIINSSVSTESAFPPSLSQWMVGSGEPVAEQLIVKGVVHSVTSILLLWSWWTEGGTVCYVCVNVRM